MNIDNTKEILEFLEYQDRKKAEDTHPVHVIEDDNPYSVVKFVTGNIRGYVDLDHTRSVLIERKVSLLRTKQQGYVPLEYFPSEVRDFSDEMKIKKINGKLNVSIKVKRNCNETWIVKEAGSILILNIS